MFIFKNFINGFNNKLYEGKRECRLYNFPVKYTHKPFGQYFINYLGPVNFNSMPIFIKIMFTDFSITYLKKIISFYILLYICYFLY